MNIFFFFFFFFWGGGGGVNFVWIMLEVTAIFMGHIKYCQDSELE